MSYENNRHEAITDTKWHEQEAVRVIREVINDTIDDFDPENLWQPHPEDTLQSIKRPRTGLYSGAAGIIWTYDYITNNIDIKNLPKKDFVPYLANIVQQSELFIKEMADKLSTDPQSPGYLSGQLGVLMLAYKLIPSIDTKRQIIECIRNGLRAKENEIMFGQPGVALAAYLFYEKAEECNTKNLLVEHLNLLWNCWKEIDLDNTHRCHLWNQDLFEAKTYQLGLIHGFAGNAMPLMKGLHLLDSNFKDIFITRCVNTLTNTLVIKNGKINWPQSVIMHRPNRTEMLLQQCHGAPGIIMGLMDLIDICTNLQKKKLIDIFEKAGDLVWQAGPLKKQYGLCHGNPGNAYAFLKLYCKTADNKWLDRAKQFAMHSIEQYKIARAINQNRMRYGLFSGDHGLACLLTDIRKLEQGNSENVYLPTLGNFF